MTVYVTRFVAKLTTFSITGWVGYVYLYVKFQKIILIIQLFNPVGMKTLFCKYVVFHIIISEAFNAIKCWARTYVWFI